MGELFQRSIQIILANQVPSGAYPAGPSFPTYQYSWFRDGAFIAYAMDVAGRHESARRFHDWAARTILRHTERAERAIEKAARGDPLGDDYLHTRYTVEGEESSDDWPNFQLDGLGTWLWALSEHLRRTSAPLSPAWAPAVELVARYLAALWAHPCYDLWEEHPRYLHPYTLAAIYAGLRAAETLTTVDDSPMTEVADQIRHFVLEHGVQNNHLTKHITPPMGGGAEEQGSFLRQGDKGTRRQGEGKMSPPLLVTPSPLLPGSSAQVDASLIGVATPYRLLSPNDPIMQATVARIEADLHCPGRGVHRYLADTYYGGGEWVLLAAWLGWYYAEVGETTQAWELLRWVEAQADADGHLPEQVSTHLLAPERYAEWEARWGPVAKPLLWSHAMYLILYHALKPAGQE